jgi:uncharacterized membrane protein YfcA
MLNLHEKSKYAISGALAGLANGFFGAGGGLFLVPLFTRFIKMDEKQAFATSVFVILPLSAVSALIYYLRGILDLSVAWPYLVGGFLGGILAGLTFRKIPVTLLRRAFGLLMIYGGIRAALLL